MITTQDKELLAKKGITEAQIAEQLACFQTGFPYLKLDAAASIEKGILAPDAEEKNAYLAAWDAYKNTDKIIVKFVPASGAASRMFKNLFEFLSAEYDKPTTKFEQAFFDGIRDFAFFDDLNVACQRTAGKDIPGLMEEGNYKAVVAALLETAGLNYGALPKGLLKFHKYPEGSRTPLEEHLAEGAMYAAGKSGTLHRLYRTPCTLQEAGGRESRRIRQTLRSRLLHHLLRTETEYRYHRCRYGQPTVPRQRQTPVPSGWSRCTDREPERSRRRHYLHQEYRQRSTR